MPEPYAIAIVNDQAVATETWPQHGSPCQFKAVAATQLSVDFMEDLEPDAILINAETPGCQDFCQKIRQSSTLQTCPVLILGAVADSAQTSIRWLEAGADDYLPATTTPPELWARLQARLRVQQQFDAWRSLLHFRREFLHLLAHDLRNPLSSIILSVAMLEISDLSEAQRIKSQQITESSRYLRSLLEHLTVLEKIEVGHVALQLEHADVLGVVQLVINGVATLVQQRSVKLQMNLPEYGIYAKIDPVLLRSALERLLTTIIKLAPSHSEIQIALQSIDLGLIQLQIVDQGAWLGAAVRTQLLDAAYLSTTADPERPAVLNLVFCKLIVEAHGGQFDLASNGQKGTQYTLTI